MVRGGSELSTADQSFDLAAIRDMLLAAFSSEELHRLFVYTSQDALHGLTSRLSRSDDLTHMVDTVVEYCRQHDLLPELLAEVAQERPRQYARYAENIVGDLPTVPDAALKSGTVPRPAPTPAPVRAGSAGVHYLHLRTVPLGAIVGISGPGRGLCVLLTEESKKVIFGRADGGGIGVPVPDVYLSRSHILIRVLPAEGEAETGRYAVEFYDLSTNRNTTVNGVRVHRTQLHHGDLIEAGGSLFRLVRFDD
jgi:hypothetical protein